LITAWSTTNLILGQIIQLLKNAVLALLPLMTGVVLVALVTAGTGRSGIQR
jgi:flagellar biosynthesis protein FlhB